MNVPVWFRLGILATLSFAILRPTSAGIRPSFSLDDCAWHATDIVLVEQTPTPGIFRVLEPWKGDLEVGSPLVIPELRPHPGAMELSDYPKRFEELLLGGPFEQIPGQPAGSRMILFLNKDAARNGRWRSADFYGQMKTSAVWIESGRLYRFQQVTNPGPSILVPWEMTVDKMKEQIREICDVQLEVAKVSTLEDAFERAQDLMVFVRSDIRDAKELALSELGKSGPPALTSIREMLTDPTFSDDDADLVKALAEAGGECVGVELHERLQEQLAFWQTTGPALAIGWWNQDPSPHAPFRDRYTLTLELVRALEHVHYRPAATTAERLARFWRSLPQLNDSSGINQMGTECEHLVETLRGN